MPVFRVMITRGNTGVRLLGLVPFICAALCVAMVSEAHASGPVSLRWSAPEDCPTIDDVLAEVNRLLGARPPEDQSTLDVTAEVQRKGDGTYRVRLEIPGADGPRVREVNAVSCAALGPAAALILAMMVDPEAALSAPSTPDSPGPTQPGQTPAARTSPVVAEPKPTTAEAPRSLLPVTPPPVTPPPITPGSEKKAPVAFRRPLFAFSGQGFVDVGSLPGPAFGLAGALGVFPGRWRFEAGALHVFEEKAPFLTLTKGGSNVNLTAFHATGGFAFMPNLDLEVVPRIRFEVGQFHAASFGISDVGEGAATFVGLGMGGVVSVRLSPNFRLGMGLDGLALLAYPRFLVTGVGVAHEPSPVVLRLSLGLEVRL